MTEKKHSLLSPSGAHRWMNCPGSVILTSHLPRTSSVFADEGTTAHDLAARCLLENLDPYSFLGRTDLEGGQRVDEDMCEHIHDYVQLVADLRGQDGALYVEQRVDFQEYTDLEDSQGTCDVIIVRDKELIILDLKYGRGVEVNAQQNEQLMLYALGAYSAFEMIDDFESVRLVVFQPRKYNTSEWSCSIDDLKAFGLYAKTCAQEVIRLMEADAEEIEKHLVPGEKQCRFCDLRAACPALTRFSLEQIEEDFEDMSNGTAEEDEIAQSMEKVGTVEVWCRAVRAAAHNALLQGRTVKGYKLVSGRAGPRRWDDAKYVEDLAVKHDIEDLFSKVLVSPTQAEKRLKKTSPGLWEELEGHISRSEGKPSVALESDKRPALDVTELSDLFEDLSIDDNT